TTRTAPMNTARPIASRAGRCRPPLSELWDINRAGRPTPQPAKENLPRGRMLEQGEDQPAMLVEPRRLTDDWHHAVGARELEERFDVDVGHLVRQRAQPLLRANLAAKPPTPRSFVAS